MTTPNIRTKKKVAKALRAYGRKMDEWTKPIDYTSKLTLKSANELLVGFMFDQNAVAEYTWEKSKYLCETIEEPLWENIAKMELRRLRGLLRYGYGGYAYHHYYKKYSVKLKEAAKLLLCKYQGDPRKIWNSTRDIDLVRERLLDIPLMGPALTNFAILWLARNYGLLGGKKALKKLNVKPDTQLTRVFKRSGLVSSLFTFEEVENVAMQLAPDFPGSLDPPAWVIGREWCRPRKPLCDGDNNSHPCPIHKVCPRIGA